MHYTEVWGRPCKPRTRGKASLASPKPSLVGSTGLTQRFPFRADPPHWPPGAIFVVIMGAREVGVLLACGGWRPWHRTPSCGSQCPACQQCRWLRRSHLTGGNLMFCLVLTPRTESEPRDAGTDQRSSGIIRLHTIKQIIDQVSAAAPASFSAASVVVLSGMRFGSFESRKSFFYSYCRCTMPKGVVMVPFRGIVLHASGDGFDCHENSQTHQQTVHIALHGSSLPAILWQRVCFYSADHVRSIKLSYV